MQELVGRLKVSTHSRPKAAGPHEAGNSPEREVSTHSRPKAAGQATAPKGGRFVVSTHSRPKAAGGVDDVNYSDKTCFNTQPPEGGWRPFDLVILLAREFQHTAARRRLDSDGEIIAAEAMFQHTAARRRLEPLSKALLRQVSQPRFR